MIERGAALPLRRSRRAARHAAFELVVIVAIEQVMLAIVLVVDDGLDAFEAFSEGPARRARPSSRAP